MYTIENMTTTNRWTDDGAVTEYHFTFGFEGKEQYLAETDEWKAEYKELSARIRKYKLYRKPKNLPEDMDGWKAHCTLRTLQEKARLMNAMRVQAKAEAGRRMVALQQVA